MRRLLVSWLGAFFALCEPQAGLASTAGDPKLDFWAIRRKGANCQNARVEPAYWQAAKAAGIQFIRLALDGWSAGQRDFLIGDADSFRTINDADLGTLRRALDDADVADVRVVLAMLSLPGARWRQLNGDRDDARLWTQAEFRTQALDFWRQLAAAVKGHPAIVAYNPLNEPHPERAFGLSNPSEPAFADWLERIRGTEADLNAFNRDVVAAIRAVDPDTPIILDGWRYASAIGLTYLEPVDDQAVLYAFHDYEPWEYTTFRVNQGRFVYPERMPPGWHAGALERDLERVAAWAHSHGVPGNRIIAAEFGVDRRVGGAERYLRDLVTLLDRRGWHWAFYAFRQDGDWGGMDYELGTRPLGADYWQAVERGEDPEPLKRRAPNPLWEILSRALATQ
jgi:endoglucanase